MASFGSTSPQPLVAIAAYHLAAGKVVDWSRGGYAVPDAYVTSVRRAGAQPVLLPAFDDREPEAALARFDGLLLAGGGDVDPAHYGAEPHPSVYGLDPARDLAELALVRAALAMEVPTLAICRGMQILNVALGGTLHQHLRDLSGMDLHGQPGQGLSVVHDVKVRTASLLAEACGRDVLRCTSHHHQGVDVLGSGLTPVAMSDDGLVEAVELAEPGAGWLVGVQWHPEMTAADDPDQQALFDTLARTAAGSGARGRSGRED